MPNIQIESYSVFLLRGGGVSIYCAKLKPLPGYGGSILVDHVRLIFPDDYDETKGGSVDGSPPVIVAFVPKVEFDTYRQMLLSESPLYFEWDTDSSGVRLSTFLLKTADAEWPGEGLKDLSP